MRACHAECEVASVCVSRSLAHTATDFTAARQLAFQLLGLEFDLPQPTLDEMQLKYGSHKSANKK